jgi:hypothetical protein
VIVNSCLTLLVCASILSVVPVNYDMDIIKVSLGILGTLLVLTFRTAIILTKISMTQISTTKSMDEFHKNTNESIKELNKTIKSLPCQRPHNNDDCLN